VTAIRETFEESGILLCKRIDFDKTDTYALANHLEIKSIDEWRKLVRKNATNFIELCSQNNCYPDVNALHLWSNWLTPPILKTKFDTKFFLAFIDSPIDSASPDGIETSEISVSTYCVFWIYDECRGLFNDCCISMLSGVYPTNYYQNSLLAMRNLLLLNIMSFWDWSSLRQLVTN